VIPPLRYTLARLLTTNVAAHTQTFDFHGGREPGAFPRVQSPKRTSAQVYAVSAEESSGQRGISAAAGARALDFHIFRLSWCRLICAIWRRSQARCACLYEKCDSCGPFEVLFELNGRKSSYRDEICDYVHNHSRMHEVVGIESAPFGALSFRNCRLSDFAIKMGVELSSSHDYHL
jgi:hypothetical protein